VYCLASFGTEQGENVCEYRVELGTEERKICVRYVCLSPGI